MITFKLKVLYLQKEIVLSQKTEPQTNFISQMIRFESPSMF